MVPKAAGLPEGVGEGVTLGGDDVVTGLGVGEVTGADVLGVGELCSGCAECVGVGADGADIEARWVGSAVRVVEGEGEDFGVGEGVTVCAGTTTTGPVVVVWSGRTNR